MKAMHGAHVHQDPTQSPRIGIRLDGSSLLDMFAMVCSGAQARLVMSCDPCSRLAAEAGAVTGGEPALLTVQEV